MCQVPDTQLLTEKTLRRFELANPTQPSRPLVSEGFSTSSKQLDRSPILSLETLFTVWGGSCS